MESDELQTEDEVQNVSTAQDPPLTNIKTEPEEDGTENYRSNFATDVKKEPENDVEEKDRTVEMDNQSESEVIGHQQSGEPTVKEKRFKCDVCSKWFTQSGPLKQHIRIVHEKIRAFPCPHCPYKAGVRGTLNAHILTHTGEKNLKCTFCDTMFFRITHLKQHIRTVHDKSRASPCPHCPYEAITSSSLKRHILTHTGEKNFECDICDKTFRRRGHLKQHIKTVHDKVRAFPCRHCPYKAGTSSILKRHILTVHTGEKNFRCDICDKAFTQNYHLKLHIRKVHDKVRA